MNSLSDGIMRELIRRDCGEEKCFSLVSEFYRAVQLDFSGRMARAHPKTSRLVHGAGIVALGYVMELLGSPRRRATSEEFARGPRHFKGNWLGQAVNGILGDGDKRTGRPSRTSIPILSVWPNI